jgi:hypothetical protein
MTWMNIAKRKYNWYLGAIFRLNLLKIDRYFVVFKGICDAT